MARGAKRDHQSIYELQITYMKTRNEEIKLTSCQKIKLYGVTKTEITKYKYDPIQISVHNPFLKLKPKSADSAYESPNDLRTQPIALMSCPLNSSKLLFSIQIYLHSYKQIIEGHRSTWSSRRKGIILHEKLTLPIKKTKNHFFLAKESET